ncbi:MAG: hypothetical protein IJV69_06870 [Kiritimatiellae bacterium]|nr:hypothetical protein [Kiritimatiellia bacterium]
MKTLFGEIILGWYRATRGPLMAALLIAAVLTLVFLPGKSDPELIYTGYGWGLYWGLLLATSLWCGGTAYALDRERHRLTLTFSKPIHRLTLWWGRWFSVWIPFCFAIVIACGLTLFRALPEGRSVQKPHLPDLTQAAIEELARLRSLGRVPTGISEIRLLRDVYHDLETRYTELRPATPQTYRFTLPETLPHDASATFRLSGAPFLGAKEALDLAIDVSCDNLTPIRIKPEMLSDSGFSITLPQTHLIPGKTLSLTLHRLDHYDAASVIFRVYHDLDLLLPGIYPWQNLIYFALMVMLTVGLTTALGIALGCSFSLPVTLFTGVLAFLACSISIFSPTVSSIDSAASLWALIATVISESLANPFSDLAKLNPLHRLIAGEALSITLMLKCCLSLFVPALLLCSLCALLSSVKDEDH